jgi:hypothetical protein
MPTVGTFPLDLSRRVPNDDLWQFKALIDTGEDIAAITIAALGAIESLGKTPPKVQELEPEGGHDAEDRMRIWAADPCGYKRPNWTIVMMGAISWCSVLEGFLRGLSATAIDVTALARVRSAFPDVKGIDWAAVEKARDPILGKMVPSARKSSQFFGYIEAVFGCKVDPVIREALLSLIAFRNTVTHPDRGRAHDEHRNVPLSDQWVAWADAVRTLAGTVIRALAERLDERRAGGEVVPLFKPPM